MKIHDDAAALIRDIESAFAELPYPGDDALVSHECLECSKVARFFRGRHWREIPLGELDGSVLPLLTPEAKRFYLPCFLIPILTVKPYQDHVSGDGSPIAVESALAEGRVAAFDAPQRAVVVRFLEFLRDQAYPDDPTRDNNRIDQALKRLAGA